MAGKLAINDTASKVMTHQASAKMLSGEAISLLLTV
ncbi:hypothetical protein VCA_001411 [Vibrio albensis VL426]|nr:hypothetical protein VCA_001411 [Vibrio cholerae VL426]